MKQQHGRPAAGLAIDREEGAQPLHQGIGWRHCISSGAGRADRSALAAAGTDRRVDRDMVAGGGDGAGRAEIEAAPAADDLRARMGAQVIGEIDVARLVEIPDEIARAQHRPQHRRRIAGISAQIAVAQVVGAETAASRPKGRAGCRNAKSRRHALDRMSSAPARGRATARRSRRR